MAQTPIPPYHHSNTSPQQASFLLIIPITSPLHSCIILHTLLYRHPVPTVHPPRNHRSLRFSPYSQPLPHATAPLDGQSSEPAKDPTFRFRPLWVSVCPETLGTPVQFVMHTAPELRGPCDQTHAPRRPWTSRQYARPQDQEAGERSKESCVNNPIKLRSPRSAHEIEFAQTVKTTAGSRGHKERKSMKRRLMVHELLTRAGEQDVVIKEGQVVRGLLYMAASIVLEEIPG